MLQQPQASYVVEVLTDLIRILLATVEWPFDQAHFDGSQGHPVAC